MEKREPAYSADGNVNWYSHHGEEYGGSRLVTKSCLALWPPQAVAHQPLSMGIPRQVNWSELPFPSPGDLPNPGTEPTSPTAHALAGEFFTTMPPILGKKKKRAMLWKSYLYSLPPLPHHPLIPQSTTDCRPCHFTETAKAPWQILNGRAITNSSVLTLLIPAPPAASNTVVHVTMLPFFFVWVSSLLTLFLPLWWVFLSFTKFFFLPSL